MQPPFSAQQGGYAGQTVCPDGQRETCVVTPSSAFIMPNAEARPRGPGVPPLLEPGLHPLRPGQCPVVRAVASSARCVCFMATGPLDHGEGLG